MTRGFRVEERKAESRSRARLQLHPVLIVLGTLFAAVLLTHILPAGRFTRDAHGVVPGSFHVIPQETGASAFASLTLPRDTDEVAKASGALAFYMAIPQGMAKSADLLIMVLFVGGTFGILKTTGALDAGVERLLQLTSGNVYLLTAGLMVLLSCGATFLGFSSEYIALVPVVSDIGRKLGLPKLFAPAIIAISDYIGQTASVANPVALGVAQPLAGVPVFSGMLPRLLLWLVLLAFGVSYVLLYLRRVPKTRCSIDGNRLTTRHLCIFLALLTEAGILVIGATVWSWHTQQLAALFLAFTTALAAIAGLRPAAAADAFVDGMRAMLLPCVLIGAAGGIGIILQSSQVIDSIVQMIAALTAGHHPAAAAMCLMAAEMAFGLLISSGVAKAAITMPIVAPIALLSGVSGNVTVAAVLIGSGLASMISPTNPLLLAFLSAASVDYDRWLRFAIPAFAIFSVCGFTALFLMVSFGY